MAAYSLVACSDVQFATIDLNSKDGNPINSCADILPTYGGNLRIAFMVDTSGSTKNTDPNKYYRGETLDNFLATYGTKSNLSYSYGVFAGTARFYDKTAINFSSSATVPYGAAADLSRAVSIFKSNIVNDGTTNYKVAFNALQANILADLQRADSPKMYSVVFMSDGQPKDLVAPINNSALTLVKNFTQTIVMSGGAVRVSAVYFGSNTDQKAIDVLKTIAIAGQGQFINTNVLPNNALNIDDAISIPGQSCGQ